MSIDRRAIAADGYRPTSVANALFTDGYRTITYSWSWTTRPVAAESWSTRSVSAETWTARTSATSPWTVRPLDRTEG